MKEPYRELADRELRAAGEDEDFPLTEIALGLAFLFGAVVFGLLNPPGTLVVSFALMIPTAALLGSALQTVARR